MQIAELNQHPGFAGQTALLLHTEWSHLPAWSKARPPSVDPKAIASCTMATINPPPVSALSGKVLAIQAHHPVFSQALTLEDMYLYGEMNDIEVLVIDEHTRLPAFKDALRWNEAYYRLKR